MASTSCDCSACRFASDRLRGFQPRVLLLHAVDLIQLLLYCLAYIANVRAGCHGMPWHRC